MNPFRARFQSRDQGAVVTSWHVFARFDGRNHFANSVDDCEDRAYERAVWMTTPSANVSERILCGVTKCLETRKFEETAIAFNGMNETKDIIEASTIVRLRFPGDNFPAQGLKHLAAFGYEI